MAVKQKGGLILANHRMDLEDFFFNILTAEDEVTKVIVKQLIAQPIFPFKTNFLDWMIFNANCFDRKVFFTIFYHWDVFLA